MLSKKIGQSADLEEGIAEVTIDYDGRDGDGQQPLVVHWEHGADWPPLDPLGVECVRRDDRLSHSASRLIE